MFRPLAFVLPLAAMASPAGAWGALGHRVSAELAARNISGHTRAHIELILDGETLAQASTWPDEQRGNPDPFWQEIAGAFHYVTLPEGRSIEQLEHPPEGDAATALEDFAATLRDPDAAPEDKALALRFIIHIVQDLHMPLHVGNGTDKGGNDFAVRWFGDTRNLHWVWDTGLVERQGLEASAYAALLASRAEPARIIAWWDPNPATWMQESADLRDRIYPQAGGREAEGSPPALEQDYAERWTPAMEARLEQAGYRLAAYLEWVFDPAGQY